MKTKRIIVEETYKSVNQEEKQKALLNNITKFIMRQQKLENQAIANCAAGIRGQKLRQ